MSTLTVHTENADQLKALVALFKAMRLTFEKKEEKETKSPYGPVFEAKMKRSEEDKKAGRYKVIKTEDLWK